MVSSERNKDFDRSPIVISIEVNDKFYATLQKQLEKEVSSMTFDQILAFTLLMFLISQISPEAEPDERSLAWSYLSYLQGQSSEGKALGELLREANIQLTINKSPVELHSPAEFVPDELIDPVEGFKQGWADAMEGRTMSREEFRRRMSENA